MPSILKTCVNVKKPDFPQFMEMSVPPEYSSHLPLNSGSHSRQARNLNLSLDPCLRISAFVYPILGPRVLCTLSLFFFFLNQGHFIFLFWVPLCSCHAGQCHSISTLQPRKDHQTHVSQKEEYICVCVCV